MSTAFVLGNGRSRLAVDLNSLRPHGKIYGCNALYREFTPDVLVATDPEISTVIMESGYAKDNVFYTRLPSEGSGARKVQFNYGYSSGPIALDIAIRDGHTRLFMLGFDLEGIGNKFNNVYADTEFYKKSSQEPTWYGNWENQIAEICRNRPVHVARVNDGFLFPDKWNGLIRQVSMQDFVAAINNCKLEQL